MNIKKLVFFVFFYVAYLMRELAGFGKAFDYLPEKCNFSKEESHFCGFYNLCQNDTHMEGELSREVIHATGVHETKRVAHRLRAQHTLACDWAEAAVGQRGCHDAGALAGHFDGAQLAGKGRRNKASNHMVKSSNIPTIVSWHTSVSIV